MQFDAMTFEKFCVTYFGITFKMTKETKFAEMGTQIKMLDSFGCLWLRIRAVLMLTQFWPKTLKFPR